MMGVIVDEQTVTGEALEHDSLFCQKHHWFLAYTSPRSEHIACVNLEQQGFKAYLPRYRHFRKTVGGLQVVLGPMFPRYVFFQPGNSRQSLASVRSTRGVHSLVRFGVEPAVVQPETLRFIQDFERARNAVDLADISPIQPGRRVRLRASNGLNGLEGLVRSVSKQRVTFLLELLGREKLVTVDHDRLELA
jgi:transcriptional antiterminator RfaH